MVDLASAQRDLRQLELDLIRLPALSITPQPSATARDEILLARSVHEQAVLLSALAADVEAFQRSWSQLAPFYVQGSSLAEGLPPAPLQARLTALNLLRLLSSAEVAQFHVELELLPMEILETPEVAQVCLLEAWLTQGAYNRVLDAKDAMAGSPEAALFLSKLAETVREEVAACAERAYDHLTVPDALSIFKLSNEDELHALADKHMWSIEAGLVKFDGARAAEDGGGLPAATDIVNNCMLYAKELERIV